MGTPISDGLSRYAALCQGLMRQPTRPTGPTAYTAYPFTIVTGALLAFDS
jgi:hypothetical protein